MALDIETFYGQWIVSLAAPESMGIAVGDPITIGPILENGQNSKETASVHIIFNTEQNRVAQTATAVLQEKGLSYQFEGPEGKPVAIQISVYVEEGGYRTIYGLAVEKDPRDIGVWGAEEGGGDDDTRARRPRPR